MTSALYTAPALDSDDRFRQRRSLYDALVMMVDDEPLNTEVVRTFLEDAGYHNFITTSDSQAAFEILVEARPDVVLLDLLMPEVSGFDILLAMQNDRSLRSIPALMLTSTSDPGTMHRALELGVADFLAKPVDPSELELRLQNTLRAKAYRDQLSEYSAVLEQQVNERTDQLEIAQRQVIHCLARAAEYRDDDTGQHVLRVGRYCGVIARQLGIQPQLAAAIESAAQLHDIGKIGIPDSILLKPGRFEPAEYENMKRHCAIGVSIIHGRSPDDESSGDTHIAPIMELAASIANTHHERWDGTGYPNGLSGDAIPIEGRIVAVADVFDALSSVRPYKEAMPLDKCFAILRAGAGEHFDPRCIDAFFAAIDRILESASH